MIAPKFLPSISWSGRAGKGKERKIPLVKYGRIVSTICSLCNKADKNYGNEVCVKDLKYKILKYAPSKFAENDTESEIIS